MSFAVNDLLQTACEDLMLTDDGTPISGELASKAESCLNRAITSLNSDGYMSLTQNIYDRVAAGNILFKKLEEGEQPSANIINVEPPDSVDGVSRKIGNRWMKLRPMNKQFMDRTNTYSYPYLYCYGVDSEIAPSGNERQVGIVYLNGTYPSELRMYVNSQLPHYKLGDTIYLSSLYYNLVLYATEQKLIEKYKLYSYRDGVDLELTKAQKAVDTNTANNRPDSNDSYEVGSYLDPYYNMMGGVGL
jgi:hypothetical protein